METLQVNTLSRPYCIHVFKEELQTEAETFAQKHLSSLKAEKHLILTDENVYRLYEKTIEELVKNLGAEILIIPSGEKQKSLRRAKKIYTFLLEKGFHRNSLLIALGGGVIGDLGGFIASTYLRGIPFVQIPTTLLAQVDSSVGGKVAVNHPLCKNSIGSFYQPSGVFTFLPFLNTLPAREFRCGLAEVVKYGVIRDRDFFFYLLEKADRINQRSMADLCYIVRRSCEIKAEIVEKDEKESHIRAILNYGHTLGHALEIAGRYRRRHGQSIAMGSLFAAYLAEKMGIAEEPVYPKILEINHRLHLPVKAACFPEEKLVSIMQKDKKNVGESITFVLPVKIGKVKILTDISVKSILRTLKDYYKEVA